MISSLIARLPASRSFMFAPPGLKTKSRAPNNRASVAVFCAAFGLGTEHQHRILHLPYPHLAQRFQAIHPRHVDVQQDGVGLDAFHQLQTFDAIAGRRDHFDIGRGVERLADNATDDQRVADQQNADSR